MTDEPQNPHLEVLGTDRVAIVKGATRLEISGPAVPRIIRWHTHALEFSPVDAGWYLAGVVDALNHAHVERSREFIAARRTAA